MRPFIQHFPKVLAPSPEPRIPAAKAEASTYSTKPPYTPMPALNKSAVAGRGRDGERERWGERETIDFFNTYPRVRRC
jgi:hypothetical protein